MHLDFSHSGRKEDRFIEGSDTHKARTNYQGIEKHIFSTNSLKNENPTKAQVVLQDKI